MYVVLCVAHLRGHFHLSQNKSKKKGKKDHPQPKFRKCFFLKEMMTL